MRKEVAVVRRNHEGRCTCAHASGTSHEACRLFSRRSFAKDRTVAKFRVRIAVRQPDKIRIPDATADSRDPIAAGDQRRVSIRSTGLANAGVDELELAVGTDQDDAALVEPELLGVTDVPRDRRARTGRPHHRHAVDTTALPDDRDPLARHEAPIGNRESRLERVSAEERHDVLRREANEARRVWLPDHVSTISNAGGSVKRQPRLVAARD